MDVAEYPTVDDEDGGGSIAESDLAHLVAQTMYVAPIYVLPGCTKSPPTQMLFEKCLCGTSVSKV